MNNKDERTTCTHDKTRRIVETALITALMTAFVFIGVNMLPIALVLYPVPFIILGVRHNIRYSLWSIVGTNIILGSSMMVGFLSQPMFGVFMLILLGPLAIALAYTTEKNYKAYQVIPISAIVFLISFVIGLNLLGYITGVSFISEIESYFGEILSLQREVLLQLQTPGYEVTDMLEILKQGYDYTILIVPALSIILSIFVVYVNYWLAMAILRRMGHRNYHVPNFKDFRLPGNMVVGIGVILIGTFLLSYLELFYYNTIFLNITTLLSVVFFIQGISVMVYFMDKKKFNPFLKGILVIMALFLGSVVSIIGLLDVVMNFRKFEKS